MIQEDKNLLLKDLCTRLPYGVKVLIPELRQDTATLIGVDDVYVVKYGKSILYCPFNISIKPYLRPMSSMTEEERNEYLSIKMQEAERVALAEIYRPAAISEIMDWLNSKHFDYRGLIEKGLAIEVTKENNPYKK